MADGRFVVAGKKLAIGYNLRGWAVRESDARTTALGEKSNSNCKSKV